MDQSPVWGRLVGPIMGESEESLDDHGRWEGSVFHFNKPLPVSVQGVETTISYLDTDFAHLPPGMSKEEFIGLVIDPSPVEITE